ncbi:MAG: IctB family putative bicarbonate transporter [Xenococcaceae cyanobacterium MO_188.B32]|nr:IctB family putative bicarbonate transporter [Xenococcaceae cyanobacterium MO_188.B32]
MNSAWTKIALANLHWSKWLNSSYFYRLVGILSSWQEGSWLLQWTELLGACLLSIVLMLNPFVSTSLIGFLLLAVVSYWIIITLSERDRQGVTPIHILVFIYWLVATIATAFSPVKSEALSGWIILTLYLGIFALAARVLRSARITTGVITTFLLAALLVSTYGIHQELIGVEQLATWNDPNSPLANDTRVYSYLGNPNLLGGYLLSAIALSVAAVFIWRSWLQKALAMTMVGVNSACLYFTDSRGAWLAMAAMTAFLLILLYYWWREYLPRFWRVWLLPLVFGSLGGLLIVAIISVEPLRLRFLSIFVGRADDSNNFRINVWEAVFKMIRDYPLTGIGPGHDAFNQIYPRYMNSRYPALSAYSIFLEHLVEMGYLGLGCFLWLIVVTLNYGIRQINRLRALKDRQGLWVIAATAAIVGLLAHGIVDTVWYRPQISTLWWFMLAILASQWETVKTEEVKKDRLLESNISN